MIVLVDIIHQCIVVLVARYFLTLKNKLLENKQCSKILIIIYEDLTHLHKILNTNVKFENTSRYIC